MDINGAAQRLFFRIHKLVWGTYNLERQGARLPLNWRVHNIVCPAWRLDLLFRRFDLPFPPGCRAIIRAMEENRD